MTRKPIGYQQYQFQVTADWKQWGRATARAQHLGSISNLLDLALHEYCTRKNITPPPPRIDRPEPDRDDQDQPAPQLTADVTTADGRRIAAFAPDLPHLLQQIKDGIARLPKINPEQE